MQAERADCVQLEKSGCMHTVHAYCAWEYYEMCHVHCTHYLSIAPKMLNKAPKWVESVLHANQCLGALTHENQPVFKQI